MSLTSDLANWCEARLEDTISEASPLPVEASHRRFYRLTTAHRGSVVLMISPPELERNDSFVRLSELFCQHHIPVPQILAHTDEWFLMSDLGHTEFAVVYNTDHQQAAVNDALSMLQHLQPIRDPSIADYTTSRMTTELELFTEWYCDKLKRKPFDLDAYRQAYQPLVKAMQSQPQVCVHRDYHCRNLLYENGHLGIVDFQDALHGPILYDPASLLRDCYYVFSETDIDRYLRGFVEQTFSLHSQPYNTVKEWFDLTAVQRQLKAIGIFARLSLRDGKHSHLDYIEPLLQRLRQLVASYPELAALGQLLATCK